MARRVLATLCVTLIAGWLASGCGGGEEPVRIGVLAECVGLFEALGQHEPILGGVEVPFVRRGARPNGARPSDGITGARVAGRPVEIDQGCTEFTEFHRLVSEVRRLVENDGADIIIGPFGPVDAIVLRKIARRYPDVTFLVGYAGGRELTLRHPAPNVYRLTPDEAQSVAGLGTYAFRTLGWRTAAIVADDTTIGWTAAAGFTAEFCALGGRIVTRDLQSFSLPPPPKPSPQVVARDAAADGVAVLAWNGSVFPFSPAPYMAALTRARPGPARRILLGGATFATAQNLRWDVDNRGIVVASDTPFQPNAEGREIARVMSTSFPAVSPETAATPAAVWFGEAGEAVARALEATHGDLGAGQTRLRAALADLTFATQTGPVRLDENRQGITTTYLGRITGGKGGPAVREFDRVTGVREDYGGIFTGASPAVTRSAPACVQRTPPPWAR